MEILSTFKRKFEEGHGLFWHVLYHIYVQKCKLLFSLTSWYKSNQEYICYIIDVQVGTLLFITICTFLHYSFIKSDLCDWSSVLGWISNKIQSTQSYIHFYWSFLSHISHFLFQLQFNSLMLLNWAKKRLKNGNS